ncbi:XRE family transcriptional regulator [bacterium]|nr:XRE family transcriptional regulator [bacterium]
MKTFAENLKKQRTASNLTQEDFATLLNTTQQRVSEWERGKAEPSLYYIVKMLKVLGISFDTLTEGFS